MKPFLTLLIFLLELVALAKGGDIVGNGGGLAEKNVFIAFQD